MLQRKRWAGSTHERRNKLRLGWHEGRVVGVVCCVLRDQILPVAWRGVAFAFLNLRFNSQIDQQQVHTYILTTVVASLPFSPQGLCIYPTMHLSLYGSSYPRAQAYLQLQPI